MSRKKRIAITGIGPISSAGHGKKELWNNLLNSVNGLTEKNFYVDNELFDKYYLHQLNDFNVHKYNIDENLLNQIRDWKEGDEQTDLYYFLVTVKLALKDCCLEYNPNSNNIGLILTAESPGQGDFYFKFLNKTYDYFSVFKKKGGEISKKDFYVEFYKTFRKTGYDLQTFMPLFHVARTFNIHGFSLFINNACASGLYAIDTAANLIRNGRCSAVIVSAVEHPDVFRSLWFKELKMSPFDGITKPFDKNANGFVLGEGGAAVVLEDLNLARKRGAHIYAEYLGGFFNQEGWKITVPNIQETFYSDVVYNALRTCKVEKSKIDLIIPHGVATRVSDVHEIRSLNAIFDLEISKPIITALKSYVGHTLGASSLLETVMMILMMEHNIVLPTLNCENSLEGFEKVLCRKKVIKSKINIALKICSAFAGFNSACIFRKTD